MDQIRDLGVDMAAEPNGNLSLHHVTELSLRCPMCSQELQAEVKIPVEVCRGGDLRFPAEQRHPSPTRIEHASQVAAAMAGQMVTHLVNDHKAPKDWARQGMTRKLCATLMGASLALQAKAEDKPAPSIILGGM